MYRRDTLRTCALLGTTGGLGLLAGCSAGGEESTDESEDSEPLSKQNFDYEEGEDGNLVITVTIENSGTAEETGYLYVTATVAESTRGTETDDDIDTVASRESREVTVPAGETKTVRVPFEFTYEQFLQKGGIEVDLRN